nr:MAG TPA: hypothetical protein [Caudoviricetes sp.]
MAVFIIQPMVKTGLKAMLIVYHIFIPFVMLMVFGLQVATVMAAFTIQLMAKLGLRAILHLKISILYIMLMVFG